MRAVLAVCVLLVGAALAASSSGSNPPKPFKGAQSYVYRFDTQVSTSLVGASPSEIQQSSATRLRGDVQLSFSNDRHAKLRLQNVRIGELNGELPKSQRVQPLEHFERKTVPEEIRQKLELPLSVSLVDGVVERINFHEDDSTWSKNIKRAVLNMIQLNLKRNDVQGLKLQSSMPATQTSSEGKNAPMFTVPEITLEGECEVVYSVQKNAKYGSEEDEQAPFNVTKTVNFKKCERTADLSMGYQANPAEQLRCLNCIRKQKPAPNALETEQIKQAGCQLECQPSKINEDKDVDRSTYVRFELLGQQQRYALKKSSMISQYIVKAQNPEAQNTVIQVVALTELTFKDQEQGDKMVPSFKQSSTDETLMYNAEWDIKAKRFFMFGDEEPSPYARAQKKEQKAAHALKKIIEQWQNQQGQGYELDSALKFSQLVTVLRQSTVKEIKSIEQTIKSMAQEQQQGQQHAVEQAMSIFQDALATAATRNTLFIVAEKIMKQEDQCTPAKAIKLIQIFTANQHSPSERQAELLERIAKSEVAHRHPALKQTAWLSFAQAVGAICQDKPAESQKSHFRVEEICPRGKKEQFKKTLLEQWKKAETIYEQVLALKMIGNAALDNSIEELTQIVKDKQQPTLVRIEAIDAMRRLRTSMPQKIRQTLLPIFQNQREEPEIRMTAFSMIVYTHPDKAIVDQIIFSVIFDRSSSLKSFVLSAAESFSKSPSSAEQEIATHLKAALKMIKLQPEQMRASRKYRVPIYVSAQENTEEQRIFLGLASIVSPANMIPIHLSASLRSAFNGEATEENFQLSFSQKNLEEWYSRVVDYAREYSSSGERGQMERRGAKDLRSIYSSLGIKNRRTGSYYLESDEQQQQDSEEQSSRTGRKISQNKPFGMIVIRTNDVDQAVLPVSDEQLPQVVRKIMSGEKPSLMSELNNELISQLAAGKHFQNHVGLNMLEKRTRIPTTSGLPVELTRKFAAVGSVSGELKARFESDAIESSRGLTAELKMRTSAIVSHVQKAQVWSPVLVNGVESVRTVEITLPINVRVRADAQKVELKVRLPEEKKVRVLALHTLPMTYTRHFDMQTQTYREPRVKSIHNWALEHTQTEQHASQQQGNWIIVSGHFHRVKSGKQLVHALYTTENNVHIYYQPSERTPKELILRASGSAFQKHATHSRPELDSFYSSGKSFKHIYPEDFEGMDLEQDEQRTSKLNSYSQKYAPSNAYKHELKLEAEARCGQKTHKAMADLKAGCDSRLKHCKIFIEAERTPIHGESQQWRMKTKVQTVAPELINDDEEPSAKQSRMLVQIESQWGSDRQSSMNVRLQAEPTKKTYWNKDTSDKWSRFLNKIDLVAEYSMPKSQQNSIQRLYELAKAQYFWQLSAEERQNQDGMIHATIVVDPISRRYANVSIQTPQERIRLEGIELPVRMAPYTLNRRPSNIQSMSQLFEHATSYGGASCRADDRKVQTFDGVRYKAPMSNGCWHVLAKDCSREEPRFVVLMKKQQSGEEKRLVKIVTPDSTIELQAKPSSQGTPIVKINGEQMSGEEKLAEEGVETSYGQVIVKKAGIKVEFNGQKVNVKVPQMYKNLQCGLCGHYNDEEEDVFRTASNELSSSLKEFHKSYTLKNEECSNVDKFYNEQESSEFAIRPQSGRKSQRKSQQGSSWFDSEEQQQSQEQSSSSRHRQSNFDSSEEEEGKWQTSQERKTGKRSPVERTQVIEYQHRVCFSEAVKKCPKGTQVDDEAQTKNAKVRFFCKERGSVEARRLLRKVRRGELVDVEAQQLQASFVEDIEVPTRCAVAAY